MPTLSAKHLLVCAGIVLPPLGLIQGLGAAPLLAALAAAVLMVDFRRIRAALPGYRGLALLLLLMAGLGAASALWSIIPGHSLFEAVRFLAISAAGLVLLASASALEPGERVPVRRAVVLGFILALAFCAVELLAGSPILHLLRGRTVLLTWYDRGAQILALTTLVVMMALIGGRRRWLALLPPVASAAALSQFISSTAVVALAAGLLAALVALRWPRLVATLTAAIFVLLAVSMPFVPPTAQEVDALHRMAPGMRTSAHHRLVIWAWTAERIRERPLLGWGMDASRALPGGETKIADYMKLDPSIRLSGQVMQLHPHDAVLQWWVELGIGGAVLGAAIVLSLALRLVRIPVPSPGARAIALGLVVAAMPPLLLSFGVWQAWWQSTLWLVAALAVACAPREEAQWYVAQKRAQAGFWG